MPLTRRLFAAAAGAALFAPALARAAEPTGALTFEPHALKLRDGATMPAEVGTFWVPENRSRPGSRRIPIRFVRLKSTSATPGSPIVYLAGGPGGSGTGTFQGPRQPVFLALRSVADVIVLDQRGTGLSQAIEPWRNDKPFDWQGQPLTEATGTAYERAGLDRAVAAWTAAGVDITGYTTVESARDIEDLRRHLGARKVNLWGISYGTHLGLAFMRAFPGSVDRVAFASVEGLDQTVKLPSRIDRALERVAAFAGKPGLVDRMRRVHARFDAEPQRMTVKGPDGSEAAFRTDSFVLRALATSVPKNPDGAGRLVQLYEALDAGVYDPVAPILFGAFLKDPQTVRGMPEAMDIASGVTDARLARVNREAPASLAGRATNYPMPQLRGAIPGIDLGDGFRRELKSDLPVLVFSGDLDVRTPLEEQAEAIAGLSRRREVLFRNGGHDLFEAHPAVTGILGDWFGRGVVETKELVLPGFGG